MRPPIISIAGRHFGRWRSVGIQLLARPRRNQQHPPQFNDNRCSTAQTHRLKKNRLVGLGGRSRYRGVQHPAGARLPADGDAGANGGCNGPHPKLAPLNGVELADADRPFGAGLSHLRGIHCPPRRREAIVPGRRHPARFCQRRPGNPLSRPIGHRFPVFHP